MIAKLDATYHGGHPGVQNKKKKTRTRPFFDCVLSSCIESQRILWLNMPRGSTSKMCFNKSEKSERAHGFGAHFHVKTFRGRVSAFRSLVLRWSMKPSRNCRYSAVPRAGLTVMRERGSNIEEEKSIVLLLGKTRY